MQIHGILKSTFENYSAKNILKITAIKLLKILIYITVNVLHLAVYSIQRFWWNTASAKSSESLNTIRTCTCIRIVTT